MRQLCLLALCLGLCGGAFAVEEVTTTSATPEVPSPFTKRLRPRAKDARTSKALSKARKAAAPQPVLGGLVASLPLLKNYEAKRVSSEERAGNRDFLRIGAHETTTIAFLQGPGEITHFWTTISTPDQNHLRNIVIRIYWDGKEFPSVEAPIGDFYGLGHATYYYFNNPVQAIGTINGMNCFWPMPFAKSARVEITNESNTPVNAFYYYVDWRKLNKLPPASAYFHAQYRQAFPNESGGPYLILDTAGARGHFVGVSLSIHTLVSGWWGEGDDIFTIDGEKVPSLWGTGSEDYFCGAWCYGKTFFNDYFGMPLRKKEDHSSDNLWNVYRLHLENPIPFKRSLKVEIEHGAAGFDHTRAGRTNSYSSVAYWYMARPTRLKESLPAAKERLSTFEPLSTLPGVFEPQYMSFKLPAGTNAETQGMGPYEKNGPWLNGDQLFLSGGVEREKTINFEFRTDKAMEGPAILRLTRAPDYGRIRVALNGEVLLPDFNGYSEEVVPITVDTGRFYLPRGKHTLSVTVLGKDERASNMFWGIDYLRIGSKQPDVEKGEPAMKVPRSARRVQEEEREVREQAPASQESNERARGWSPAPGMRLKAGQVIQIRPGENNALELRIVGEDEAGKNRRPQPRRPGARRRAE